MAWTDLFSWQDRFLSICLYLVAWNASALQIRSADEFRLEVFTTGLDSERCNYGLSNLLVAGIVAVLDSVVSTILDFERNPG